MPELGLKGTGSRPVGVGLRGFKSHPPHFYDGENMSNESQYKISMSTFSIVGVDVDNGDLGVAVASKFLAVGHVVPWVKTNVGAIATQAWANVRYGPLGLRYLEKGINPKDVINRLTEKDRKRDYRQIGIVNFKGESAAFTGKNCLSYAGHITGNGFSVQGNILKGEEVLNSMARTFENAKGELVDKLIAALEAGDNAGGDKRGKQSAALIVLRKCGGYGGCRAGVDKYVDIRVDDSNEPIAELKRIFKIWDLTFLKRDKELLDWEDIWSDVAKALIKLGYLDYVPKKQNDKKLVMAFNTWVSTNNFENKLRRDKKVWKSIYDYLLDQSKS